MRSRKKIFAATITAIVMAIMLWPHIALTAVVKGLLPGSAGQVHFENRVTGDVVLVPTAADGSFSVILPAGQYDLRDDRGNIIARNIQVPEADINLGTISPPSGGGIMGFLGVFQRERIAEGIVQSPAPATAREQVPGSAEIPSPAPAVSATSSVTGSPVHSSAAPPESPSPESAGSSASYSGLLGSRVIGR
jgi:hypothetical protein